MNKNIGDMTNDELMDFIIELQEENSRYERKIDKALDKIEDTFDRGDDYTIIDDLLELEKILKGSDNNDK